MTKPAFQRQKPVVSCRIDAALVLLSLPLVLVTCALFATVRDLHVRLAAVSPFRSLPTSQALPRATRRFVARSRLLSDLPPCADAGRAKTFLLVFQGRSGSTPLLSSLERHSQLLVARAVASPGGDDARAARDTLRTIRAFFANRSTMHLTKGFKIRPALIAREPAAFARLARAFDTRVVWSFRSNVFKQAVGDYRVHEYGDTASFGGVPVAVERGADARATAVHVGNRTRLLELMARRIQADRAVADAVSVLRRDGCVLPLSYESYVDDAVSAQERLQRFLGVDVAELHAPDTLKANADAMCELVSNWDEVCEVFYHCPEWRWMVEDDRNGCSCSTVQPSTFKEVRGVCSLDRPVL